VPKAARAAASDSDEDRTGNFGRPHPKLAPRAAPKPVAKRAVSSDSDSDAPAKKPAAKVAVGAKVAFKGASAGSHFDAFRVAGGKPAGAKTSGFAADSDDEDEGAFGKQQKKSAVSKDLF
jgi:hypothetical protein